MLVIGVDPGLGGALCAFYGQDEEGDELIADIIDMPTMPHGSRSEVDAITVLKWLRRWNAGIAYVENVQPMPSIPDKKTGERRNMGAATNFRFGMAVGSIRGILQSQGIEVRDVHPRTWTDAFELKGGSKKPHLRLARALWTCNRGFFRLEKHEGRADAALIAAFGHRRDFSC